MGNFISKYKYLIALGIFIVHYIFKTYALGVNGFWFDECYSVNMSSNSIGEILESTQTTDPNPPLYLIILHYWMYIFGDSEFGVRLLSVVASGLAASALFLLCLRFLNWQSAIFASIMFFTSNELYYYGQEARAFSLVILFVIFSDYFYLSILKDPKKWKAFVLGACYAIIFYLHIVAVFNMVAQFMCLPLILIALHRDDTIDKSYFSFKISISKRAIECYLISLVVFVLALLPWTDRLMNIMGHEGKTWWVGTPTYEYFKYCIYDLFNSKELYQVYIISFVSIILLLLFFKQMKEHGIQRKIILMTIITGPFLMYLIFLMAGFTPIFLKRYILFTFVGFILLYSYVFSLIKVNFNSKFTLFVILGFFTFDKIIFPRPVFFEYDKAMVFIKKVEKPHTLITNDMQDLFAYYYDNKIFHLHPDSLKRDSLLKRNVYTFTTNDWVDKENLIKYDHIYYTTSFSMWDPANTIKNALSNKFILTNDIQIYKGIIIYHYFNPNFKDPVTGNNSPLVLYDKKPFHLKASNNKYLVSDGGNNNALLAVSDNKYQWETFRMARLGNSKIAISAYTDKYFSTELNNKNEVTGVRPWVGEWETYTILDLGDGFVALKACNGKYLSLDEKSKKIFAVANTIGRNERFQFVSAQ